MFYQPLAHCRHTAGDHGFRFKNKLHSLGATLITLRTALFDWPQHRRTMGAMKLHLLLDYEGPLPSYAVITEDNVRESCIGSALCYEPESIVIFDRGYNGFNWLAACGARGVFLIPRMKKNTV